MKSEDEELISIHEFARVHSLTRGQIEDLLRKGLPVTAYDRKIDSQLGARWLTWHFKEENLAIRRELAHAARSARSASKKQPKEK